jgi:hypothetical protein
VNLREGREGFLKQGTTSAVVQRRQYSSTADRTGNLAEKGA